MNESDPRMTSPAPLHNAEPSDRIPLFPVIATYVLLVGNVTIFALTTVLAAMESPSFWDGLRLWLTGSARGPQEAEFFQQFLLNLGASHGPYLMEGEYWRLVIPMFLHIGVLHLLINGYALFLLGRILEKVYGYGRFTLLYVSAGIASSALSMALSNSISAGASGSIFGIAGGLLMVGFRYPQAVPQGFRRAFGRGILPLIVINLILGFALPMIDNWGHLGGLIGGAFIAFWVRPPGAGPDTEFVSERPSQGIVLVPVLIVALAFSAEVQHYLRTQHVAQALLRADTYVGRGQFEKSLQELQPLVQERPQDDRLRIRVAITYLGLERLDEAQQLLEQIVKIRGDSLAARAALAAVHRRRGSPQKAEEQHAILLRALAQPPGATRSRQLLGDICFELKLYEEAIVQFKQALALDPENASAHNNLAWLYATTEDRNFRRPRAALDHAYRAVRLTRWQEPNVIDTLAEALHANGRNQEAVEIQEKTLALDPDNPEFQSHMKRYRQALSERKL